MNNAGKAEAKMQQQQVRNSARDARVATIVEAMFDDGAVEGKEFSMVASSVTPEVWVRQVGTGRLVAYSSTESDRVASIEEFASDYFA